MSVSQITKLRENEMLKRMGRLRYKDEDDDDPVMSLGSQPPADTRDDPYSVGSPTRTESTPIRELQVSQRESRDDDSFNVESEMDRPSGGDPRGDDGDPSTDWRRIKEAMDALDNPEHGASDAYAELLRNAPQMNRPSIMRRIVAGGIGLGKGGIADAEKVLHEPYYTAKDEWETKEKPMYNAATLERQSNANSRQLASSLISASEQTKRTLEYQKAAEERIRLGYDRNRISEENNLEKNQLARLKQKNSGIVFDFRGPTVTYVDKNNPGPPVDTHFPTGRLTDLDKLEMNQDNEMERIAARGAQARETKEAVPGFNPESVTIRTEAAANKPLTAKEANDARSAELRRIKETDPEGEGRFIKLAPDGVTATLRERPGYGIPYWGDEANQKEIDAYDALNKRVSESIAPPKGAPGGSSGTSTTNTPPGQTSGGGMYQLQRDAENPNRQRKTYDGGKTWSYSNDGGKTWDGGQ